MGNASMKESDSGHKRSGHKRSKKHMRSRHMRSRHKRSRHMRNGYGRRTRRYHGGVKSGSRLNPNASPPPPVTPGKSGSKKSKLPLPRVRSTLPTRDAKGNFVVPVKSILRIPELKEKARKEKSSTKSEVEAARERVAKFEAADKEAAQARGEGLPVPSRTRTSKSAKVKVEMMRAASARKKAEEAKEKKMEKLKNEPAVGSRSRLEPMNKPSLGSFAEEDEE